MINMKKSMRVSIKGKQIFEIDIFVRTICLLA